MSQPSLRALTVWQPWGSLIMQGFKPFEFRGWDFSAKPALRALIGERVVIHAGARTLDPYWPMRLKGDLACADLRGWCHGGDAQAAHAWLKANIDNLPFSAGLGTVVLGEPIPPRTSAHRWAWPVSDPRPFRQPVPAKGHQGFWWWSLFGDCAPDMFADAVEV